MINKRNFLIMIVFSAFFSLVFDASALAEQGVGVGIYKPTTQVAAPVAEPTEVVKEPMVNSDFIKISEETAKKGFQVKLFDEAVVLYLTPGVVTGSANISLYEQKTVEKLPWKLTQISPVYNLDITGNGLKDDVLVKAFNLQIKYKSTDKNFKQVYYFNEAEGGWKALPTTDYPNERFVRTLIKSSKIKLAVFSNPAVLTVGKASWYAYKPGLFCASPDFNKGSKLRVTNLDNGKSVEVTVNDWGPERKKHPDRVVDLSKEAFKEIANLSQGVINISISPIETVADRYGRVLGVKESGLSDSPTISARSAIIINEDNGKIIYSKNSSQVSSLASLTKIVALSVFLNQGVPLDKKVKYSSKDAAYNALYVSLSEAANINLKDGDMVTIKDLVYGSLVASANNLVESLVRNSGLSREKFIQEMNSLVKSWGANNTHFIEPTGLSEYNTTTPYDYALITSEAFKNKTLAAASVTNKYTIKVLNRSFAKSIVNTNKLIVDQAQENLKLDALGINGSKTGYLKEAGYCLMTRFKSANGQFVIVTLGASSRERSFSEMMDLIKYANLKS